MMKKKIIRTIIVCLIIAFFAPILWMYMPKKHSDARKLIKAISAEDTAKVQRLLESGVDPNATNYPLSKYSKYWTFFEFSAQRPLTVACDTANLEIISLLIEHGATAEYIEYTGWSPLREVLLRTDPNDLEVVKLLLANGAEPQAVEYAMTSVFAAASMRPVMSGTEGYPSGYSEDAAEMITEIVDLLLDGGDVNAQTEYGNTLLMYASQYGNIRLVEYLLDKGCDVTLKNNQGDTAYDFAVEHNQEAIIALLENHKNSTGDRHTG